MQPAASCQEMLLQRLFTFSFPCPVQMSQNATMISLIEVIAKQKEAIRVRSRQVFSLVRPEHMGWQPEREALRVGEMLRHLWTSEEGTRRVALEGNFAYYEKRIPEGLRAIMGSPEELTRELEHLERVHNETIAAIRAFPQERLEDDRVHAGLCYRRKIYAILMGITDHEVHHRAQLMTYLRILGTPVPEVVRRSD